MLWNINARHANPIKLKSTNQYLHDDSVMVVHQRTMQCALGSAMTAGIVIWVKNLSSSDF